MYSLDLQSYNKTPDKRKQVSARISKGLFKKHSTKRHYKNHNRRKELETDKKDSKQKGATKFWFFFQYEKENNGGVLLKEPHLT